MFQNILVAIDRSNTSHQAFDTALSLAKVTGARLILLHILSSEDEEAPHRPTLLGKDFYPRGSSRSVVQIYEDLWAAYEDRGLTLVQSRATEAIAQGIATETIQRVGRPGPMICEFALEARADLIILGRQGEGATLNDLLLGSVSNYVLHHAPCSVLVIPRKSIVGLEHEAEQPASIAT